MIFRERIQPMAKEVAVKEKPAADSASRKLRPLGDKLMIRVAKPEAVTKMGIILPDAAQEKPKRGLIIAAGPGKLNENGERLPQLLSAGEEVIFNSYAGTEVKLDGEPVLLISAEDVLAVIE
jgi:chaperonin GroES